MNSVFVLLLLSTQGVYEIQSFDTMKACLAQSSTIKKADTLCVERKVADPEAEVKKMLRIFRNLREALDSE